MGGINSAKQAYELLLDIDPKPLIDPIFIIISRPRFQLVAQGIFLNIILGDMVLVGKF